MCSDPKPLFDKSSIFHLEVGLVIYYCSEMPFYLQQLSKK